MAHVPEDARADLDREELEAGQADIPPATVDVPEDVKAELDLELRARAEPVGDEAQRRVPLDDIEEAYRG